MTITKISETACETILDVNGTRLRLFMITGGTPALSFEDHWFCQRYPTVERWSNEHWKNNHYDHQTWNNGWEGPSATEVLPNGHATLLEFVATNLPKHDLRMERIDALPFRHKESGRFHNTEQRYYFTLNVRVAGHYIGGVTMNSACACGQLDHEFEYITDAWRHLHAVLAQYPCTASPDDTRLEDLTDDQFAEMKEAMEAVA